jgi:hypothetical protein
VAWRYRLSGNLAMFAAIRRASSFVNSRAPIGPFGPDLFAGYKAIRLNRFKSLVY